MTKVLLAPPALGTVLSLTGLPGGSNKIHDRSPYGNVGTIVGATWAKLPGGLWCLSFDGSDDLVSCGTSSVLNPSDDMTLMAWIKMSGFSGGNGNGFGIITRDAVNQRAYVFQIAATNGYINFYVSKTAAGAFTSLIDTAAIPTERWNLVTGTYHFVADGSSLIEIFLNGVSRKNASNAVGPIVSTTSETQIGNRQYVGVTIPFAGDIALPRVFNQALSPLDIQNIFHREKHLFGVC